MTKLTVAFRNTANVLKITVACTSRNSLRTWVTIETSCSCLYTTIGVHSVKRGHYGDLTKLVFSLNVLAFRCSETDFPVRRMWKAHWLISLGQDTKLVTISNNRLRPFLSLVDRASFFFTNLMRKFLILIHLLYSSTCFEHNYAHLQKDNCISIASGIAFSLGDCSAHRLPESSGNLWSVGQLY